jgi:hypothetical protein
MTLTVAALACVACADGEAPSTGQRDGDASAGVEANGGSAGMGAGDTAAAGFGSAAGSGSAVGGTAGTDATAGLGGLGTQPGTFEPNDDLDPSVTFEWKESLPGQGTCKPGKYTGMFTCDYIQMGQTMPLVVVSGPITITLTKSMSGEFLEVSDGQLDGIAQGIIGFTSMLTGKLDCNTLEFTASAVMGTYGFGDPKLFPFGTFEGALTGTLDTATLVLSGDWALTENMGGVCAGPWTASFTP